MRRHPFLDFQVMAERAGYPALLIVSLVCLALVVVPVLLLALTQAVWVLILALLSLGGAVAILFAGIGAALADGGEADLEPPKAAPEERSPVTRLRRNELRPPADGHDRKAA
jgi:hypothetical protein